MKAILTEQLWQYLKDKGYTHFFSKTTIVNKPFASVCITLVPVKTKPVFARLPMEYDTFFDIDEEPRQMAKGVDDAEVLVELKEDINPLLNSNLKADIIYN
jgi:hypothetical protein